MFQPMCLVRSLSGLHISKETTALFGFHTLKRIPRMPPLSKRSNSSSLTSLVTTAIPRLFSIPNFAIPSKMQSLFVPCGFACTNTARESPSSSERALYSSMVPLCACAFPSFSNAGSMICKCALQECSGNTILLLLIQISFIRMSAVKDAKNRPGPSGHEGAAKFLPKHLSISYSKEDSPKNQRNGATTKAHISY